MDNSTPLISSDSTGLPTETFDRHRFTLRYLIALGLLAIVITIAFTANQFIVPKRNSTEKVIQILSTQELYLQKMAFEATQLPFIKDATAFEQTKRLLKETTTALQDYHQALLYGSDGLGLDKLTSEKIKNIYFHPATNLDKKITDVLVNAKLLAQLPADKIRAENEHINVIRQAANSDVNELLAQVKSVYQKDLATQKHLANTLLLGFFGIALVVLIFMGLFIFRPIGNKVFKIIERSKRTRYQLIAIKKKNEAENKMLEKTLVNIEKSLDSFNSGILIFNQREKKLKFNKQFSEMWQIPEVVAFSPSYEGIKNSMIQSLAHPEKLPENVFDFSRNIKTLSSHLLELTSQKIIECSAEPINIGHSIIGSVWSFHDVTNYIKQYQEAVEKNNALLNVFNSMGEGVVVTDESGRFTHLNPAAKTLLGVVAEEGNSANALGRYSILDPKSHHPISDTELPFIKATNGEITDEMELIIKPPEKNESKHVNASGRPIKNNSGKVIGGVVVIRQNPEKPLYAETDTTLSQFLDNVNEGVFFVDKDLSIRSKYSKALENILGKELLQNQNVIDMFKNLLPVDLISVIDDYLKLIFNSVVTERYVEELNPVKEIEVEIEDTERGWQTKYLEFSFNRIINNDVVQSIMVTVRDATEQITSVKQLKQSQTKIQKQIDLLFRVIHVDPKILEKFVEDCAVEIAGIHLTLKHDSFREKLPENLAKISRSLLSIRENAAFLDLKIFEEKASRFEKHVLLMRSTPTLNDNDMRGLQAHLDDLHSTLDEVKHIIDHMITKLKVKFRGKREEESKRFMKSIENYVYRISQEAGKKVQLDFSQFDALALPFEERRAIRDILVELLQNLVQKSIESPQERENAGKSPTGLIQLITIKDTDQNYEFAIRDDGRGIKMLEQHGNENVLLSNNGEYIPNNLNNNGKALDLIIDTFSGVNSNELSSIEPEFKVAESKVKKLKGKINAFSQHGEYCEFYISLPKNEKKTNASISNTVKPESTKLNIY